MQRTYGRRSARGAAAASIGMLSLVGVLALGGPAAAAVDSGDPTTKAEAENSQEIAGAEADQAEENRSDEDGLDSAADEEPVEDEETPVLEDGGTEVVAEEVETSGEVASPAEAATLQRTASRSLVRSSLVGADIGVTKCSIPKGTYASKSAKGTLRLSGANRYATSAAIAKHVASSSSTGQSAVFIASGAEFADGLALSALATQAGWPILLTDPNKLSAETAAIIRQQQPTHVYIAGGTGAVSKSVEKAIVALSADGVSVQRFDGKDRYQTSRKIAECFEEGTPAFVTAGDDFPDAVVAAAPAAQYDGAVVLTSRNAVNSEARAALQTLQSKKVYVVGGSWSSSQQATIKKASGASSVAVYSGKDRYETSAKVAAALFKNATAAAFSTGSAFPDALSGASVADLHGVPILLTNQSCRPKALESAVKNVKTRIVLGGTGAVSDAATTTTCKTAVPAYTKVAAAAKQQVGKRYAYGASGPNSFDCSGLTQYAHKLAGINIPRTTWDQWSNGKSVGSPRPGDIVVLGGGGHVGIYMGNGMMVDAGNPRVNVAYRQVYATPNDYVRYT